mgnify:CR=1 FL=1
MCVRRLSSPRGDDDDASADRRGDDGFERRPADFRAIFRAATGADFVFSCVGNDDDVRSVLLHDDGALAGMTSGSVLIDNTTASADLARELYVTAKNLYEILKKNITDPIGN